MSETASPGRRPAAAERVTALPGVPTRGRADLRRVRRHLAARSHDWAEPTPEWGLAGNAAFIAGPRWLTDSLDLQGRVFLHSYDPAADSRLQVLHTIVNAPVVVAQWINSQYYFATVDPVRFGAGDKSTHNVVGDFGVMTGAAGDLRLGLPWQAVADREDRAGTAGSVHEPLRLAVVLYADPGDIDTVLLDSPHVARLIGNGWITLVAVVPGSGDTFEMDRRLTWLRGGRAPRSRGTGGSGRLTPVEHHPWVGILTLVEHRRAFAISAGTGLLLLLVLLAGADRPPPPGFLWLVAMVAVLVGAGTVVIPRWWERRQRVGRARMVVAAAAQGAAVGLAVALVIALLPRSGAPEAGPAGWLIWFALLGFGGAVTAAMVAWVADLLRPRPPRPPAVSGSRDF